MDEEITLCIGNIDPSLPFQTLKYQLDSLCGSFNIIDFLRMRTHAFIKLRSRLVAENLKMLLQAQCCKIAGYNYSVSSAEEHAIDPVTFNLPILGLGLTDVLMLPEGYLESDFITWVYSTHYNFIMICATNDPNRSAILFRNGCGFSLGPPKLKSGEFPSFYVDISSRLPVPLSSLLEVESDTSVHTESHQIPVYCCNCSAGPHMLASYNEHNGQGYSTSGSNAASQDTGLLNFNYTSQIPETSGYNTEESMSSEYNTEAQAFGASTLRYRPPQAMSLQPGYGLIQTYEGSNLQYLPLQAVSFQPGFGPQIPALTNAYNMSPFISGSQNYGQSDHNAAARRNIAFSYNPVFRYRTATQTVIPLMVQSRQPQPAAFQSGSEEEMVTPPYDTNMKPTFEEELINMFIQVRAKIKKCRTG